MPEPSKRSRRFRRVMKKTPGGVTRLMYKKRRPKQAHCAACGKVLPGTPRERAKKLHRISKTSKRPKRPFGGMLCSKCMRTEIIKKARK